jgi:tRNA-Thr(GGU) m(6)t(6)A37 methyltransferase TsaA
MARFTAVYLLILTGLLGALLTIMACQIPDDGAQKAKLLTLDPIGRIQKNDFGAAIEIEPRFQDALLGLSDFSHVWVLWWFDQNDNPEKRSVLRVHPRGNPDNPLTGVFATRSPARPNLIAMTLCKIRSIDKNVVWVEDIDAFDDTTVLDLKPYIPGSDGASEAAVPAWIHRK